MGPVLEVTAPADKRGGNLEHLLKVRVPVIVRLATKKMNLGDIGQMCVGTIIEYDKRPSEELELLIRDKVIGYGMTVKTGEHFGLRITSICDLRQSIQAMGPQE
jgi:flagellar motor switch protein FliN/FliY